MKKFRIPIQEEVRLWQHIDILIETDDNIETVWKHIKDGDLIFTYSYDEVNREQMWETEENIQYSYEYTKLEDIEEIE